MRRSTSHKIAAEFLKRFCAGDVEGLVVLLAEDLVVEGPSLQVSTRDAYLNSLRKDPPEKCSYRVLSITEDPDSAAIFYDYAKREGSITIAQLFRIENRKIAKMLVVFDGRGFVQQSGGASGAPSG